MSSLALGGLNNDVAAPQLDGGVLAMHGDGELRALVHLHLGAVSQAEHGPRIARCADSLALGQLISGFEGRLAFEAHAVKCAAERFHLCPHACRRAEESVLNEI